MMKRANTNNTIHPPPKGHQKPKATGKSGRRAKGEASPNVRRDKFCENIVAGMVPADAWIAAGYGCSRDIARRNAQESLSKPDTQAIIARLRESQTDAALLTRDEKRKLLRDMAKDRNAALVDRLRAIAEDNKMAGHYEPEKIEVEDGPKKAAAIAARAARVAGVLSRFARPKADQAANGHHSNGHTNGTNGHAPLASLSRWKG